MSEKQKDGGSAFPVKRPFDDGGWETGMTLRDYFAACALPAIIALNSDAGINGECADAYQYADRMLAERERTGT